jgi:hypothetical protein
MASQAGTVGATVAPGAAKAGASRYYLRFDRVDRMMHALLMITFIGP